MYAGCLHTYGVAFVWRGFRCFITQTVQFAFMLGYEDHISSVYTIKARNEDECGLPSPRPLAVDPQLRIPLRPRTGLLHITHTLAIKEKHTFSFHSAFKGGSQTLFYFRYRVISEMLESVCFSKVYSKKRKVEAGNISTHKTKYFKMPSGRQNVAISVWENYFIKI